MSDNFKNRRQQILGLSVVITELYVHSAVKMSFAVPQVLNVILKPNKMNEALKKKISRYEKQSSIFKKAICSTNQTMESSYKVAKCIAKREKPSTDSDFIKGLFINCSEVLFEDFPNRNVIFSRIKNLPVSARTVERRVEDMAADVKMQQVVALQSVNTFSVALSVTIDGAAAMVERDCGFVALIEDKIGHPVIKFHCIIHQESLCAKMPNSNLVNVIATTTKIVDFIVARSATTHRQFRSFLMR